MKFKWRGMSEDGETVTLRRFSGDFCLPDYATEEWMRDHRKVQGRGVVVDIETTGLDRRLDSVIEVGLRRFTFNILNGDILRVGEPYSGLQDPNRPLSDVVRKLTGLTQETLAGKCIDWAAVENAFSDAEIIVAHNAAFDRPFIDRNVKISTEKLWGCSLHQIDWTRRGFFSHKLESLAIYHGFFIDAHRALNDADALLHLLSMKDGDFSIFYELLKSSRRPCARVTANGSPYESKDHLRIRGYRWDTVNRVWYKVLFEDTIQQEVSWLESMVYRGSFVGRIEQIPAIDNFK